MPKNKGAANAGSNSKSQRTDSFPPADKTRAKQFDQYYTKDSIAELCWTKVVNHLGGDLEGWQFVEPSAGEGAFLRKMPADTIAIDIDPKAPGTRAADFLKVKLRSNRRIAVIGNPPFGKNASGAVAHIQHAARQSDLIGMILPRTFCKASVQNRLDPAFHLVFEMKLPMNAFTFLGKDRNVPVVFQIWERRQEPRAKIPIETRHSDFVFTTADQADYGLWRIGVKAGEIHSDFAKSRSSHYFIRATNKAVDVKKVMSRLAFAFADAAGNTAGNPSLAKSEIVALYKAYMVNPNVKVLSISAVKVRTVETTSDLISWNPIDRNQEVRRREMRSGSSRRERIPRLRLRRWRRLQRQRQRQRL